MAAFVKVASTGDLGPGEAKRVEAQGKRIALFNRDGAYYAIEETCPHRGGPLSEGQVDGNTVVCPWHGAKFDLVTGGVLGPPARVGVASFRTRVTGSDIEVEL